MVNDVSAKKMKNNVVFTGTAFSLPINIMGTNLVDIFTNFINPYCK